MADVFISYSKSDRSYALDLAEELRARGISVWIDQTSIRGAKNWASEIVTAINDCSTMLCLLSPNSIASENVAREVHLASEKRKHILPVLLEKVALPPKLEYPLAGLQRVYYHDSPAIFQALESLRGTLAIEVLPEIAPIADNSIRVAVLPFDDLSPEHDNQWFADGMMDELISTLGAIEHVKIPSRSDVLPYRDHKKKSRDIAREIGVRYLIEGGVRKAKDKIRINASLIDTLKSEQLWTNKFDGTFDDVFDFQESVSKQITDALRLKLTSEEKQRMEDRGTTNTEAYELYLKGRHEQYYLTKESYLRALDLYEHATKRDPNYAKAYIGVASVSCVFYREYSKKHEWLERAEKNVEQAEKINGETSKSLWIRGMIAWQKGEDTEAIAILDRAAKLDPTDHNVLNVIGAIQLENNNYAAAADAFHRVTELLDNAVAYFNLLNALSRGTNNKKQLKEEALRALPIFDRYLLREPTDFNMIVNRAYILLWAERKEEALEAASSLVERNDLSGQTLNNLACLFENLGKPDVYLLLFRKAILLGYRDLNQAKGQGVQFNDIAMIHAHEELISMLTGLVEAERNAF